MNLKSLLTSVSMIACATLVATAYAAPAGSTGECKDGTYSSAASKRGACAGHGGVKDWYATDKAESATKAATAPAAVAPAASAPSKATEKSTGMPTTAAAGGGPGQVWVNTSSKVYHCQGDKWYGKTKKGEYVTETAAKAAGNHADHGKACG